MLGCGAGIGQVRELLLCAIMTQFVILVHTKSPKTYHFNNFLGSFCFGCAGLISIPFCKKISSKENHIADFISRNHNEDDISDYFVKNGYPVQTKLKIPIDWYNFVVD